ncbi:MAG TPA: cytochrome c3 family protein, partial [Gammaproteobacteria bacterium]|nr:cytochrome c3 family protein [Gammaproteobacteria bacterium]
MAQVFKPSSNTYARLSLAVVGILGGLAFGGLYQFNTLRYVTGNHEALAQPVQFSHKHHNGELGIDCRYCHTS